MRRRTHFWLNIEAGLIFLVAATLDCVSPYGFHTLVMSPRRQSNIKISSPRDASFGNEASEVPGWKKFRFWKRKRNYWSDGDPYFGKNLLDGQLDVFDLSSEKPFYEPQNYDAFNLVNARSEDDPFDPKLVYNDIKPELPSKDLGYWHFGKLLLATGNKDFPTGIPASEKKEGFFVKSVDGCEKTISLDETTQCFSDIDCKDCNGFVFYCENNFCREGVRPVAGGIDLER